jgi:hypothetical protein
MQNPTPIPTPPPTPPVPVPLVPALPPQPSLFEINPMGPTRPLTPQEASIIRQQRSEMSSQLTSAQGRREELLNQIRTAPPGTEQGLRDQYQVLSNRIVAIETDIEASGRVLRTGQVPAGMTLVPPRSFNTGNSTDDAERGASLAAAILLPIGAIYMWRAFRRRRRGGRREVEVTTEQDSRFERLEQAVDAIALEIERVGEAQRYQAKLLSEANMMPAAGLAQRAAEPVRAREFDR